MKEFEPIATRQESWRWVENAGLRRKSALPLLEPHLQLQPLSTIADRLLCIGAVAAHAFGFPLASTEGWIDQERLRNALSHREQAFLAGAEEHLMAVQMQLHGLYALAWCTSVVDHFSADGKMPDDLIRRFPDIKRSEPSTSFRSRLLLRSRNEILPELDAAYCFPWGMTRCISRVTSIVP